MTKFECNYGHEFAAPVTRTMYDLIEATETRYFACPECHTPGFRVVQLGGTPTEPDACEGSCTL